jgi:hypothetical protein
VRVTGRIPIEIPPNRHNAFYLETKRRDGHLLSQTAAPTAGEQLDCAHRTSNGTNRLALEQTDPLTTPEPDGR